MPNQTIPALSNIENLDLYAKQVVEGFIIGLHKSPYHGFSVEFAEYKPYNPGQPVKDIDWKVYGRTDKLFIKNFEEETNLRCQVVIDNSSSMLFPKDSKKTNKLSFSIIAAAALAKLLKRQRDAVGLSIFNNSVDFHLSPKSTLVHHKLMMTELHAQLNNSKERVTTEASQSLHEIAERIHKRSLVIVFSDMLEGVLDEQSLNETFLALQHLKYKKHEVILFNVLDKQAEEEFNFENRPYVFKDMETGEEVKLFANEAKKEYLSQVTHYKKQLMLKCGQYKIDFVEVDINKGVEQVLLEFLLKRKRVK